MADNVYNLKFTLSNGDVIDAGQITAPQGPKGDKGDSADIPYSSSTPFMDGVGSVGSANTVARGDHRHPTDTSRQEKLVSGTNIKTINGQSVLGSGNIQSYPVGSIYLSTSTSPSSLFGGTWEQITGKFLFASDDVLINGVITTAGTYHVGATGGEATHTLTIEEMPAHSHDSRDLGINWGPGNNEYLVDYTKSSTKGRDVETRDTGGGKSHNNMPPYLVVYMWKRIA